MPWLESAQQDLPYQSGAETSRDAAVQAKAFYLNQRGVYFAWLQGKGAQGGTDAEAETELGMRRQSICARRAELMKDARVTKTERRRAGCAVWVSA